MPGLLPLVPIDALKPWERGGTIISEGLVWGWRAISPRWQGLWSGSPSQLPLAYNTVKRNREMELRRALRELRSAIDAYREFHFSGLPPGQFIPIQERTQSGFPKTLEILSDGFVPANRVDDKKKRFLRRMPIDPMTGEAKWGVKSSTDDPDSSSTNGEDVFDVFSLSDGKALNGSKYKDW